ncbi:hypothetical protein [Nitrososphaera sp.]|uniref:hypothetical protein n=1 Tax=Nitrososphaera sp. TaxID=1971748 RepID=UPI00178F6B4F|nr:hypothetical protein [Nitrososphaera sp.]NWG38018.1 hypothetical protein [Nitrososphaera sp.]
MTNSRIKIAQALAGATLALGLTNALANPQLLVAGIAPAVGISTIVLAVAAFAVSLKRRSYLVGGMLAAGGVAFMVPAVMALGDFSVIVVPGPILVVIFGLLIFGLGVAKTIGAARKAIVATERI